MLKRIAPPFFILLTVLLDTAVIPILYAGRFLVPLSLILVVLIGIQLGRTMGMLYGMIAGLLLDISTGHLGMKLFPYIIIGFLIGFLLDQQPQISRAMERSERIQLVAVRMIWVVILLLLHEIVMLVIQYFNTAIFEWEYVLNLLIRAVGMTVLVQLLYPLTWRLFRGKARKDAAGRSTREVKHF